MSGSTLQSPMPQELLLIKNIHREGPGLIEHVLTERGLPFTVIDLDAGEHFPSPQRYSAVIVFGGPDSANDETEKMREELERVRECLSLGVPYLGICLGMQVLVKAAGGTVLRNAVKEVGFRDQHGNLFEVELTAYGMHDPLFRGLSSPLTVFQLHGETAELTDDMTLLAGGTWCRNQVVKVRPLAYGLQCHCELTPALFEDWITEDPDLKKLSEKGLRRDFSEVEEGYTRTGKQLFCNFLHLAGIVS